MRTHTKHICRCIFLWSAAIALGGAPGIRARAQQTQQSPQTQQAPVQRQDVGTTDDRASFDQFLAQHKDIAKDLQNKPGLVNDPDYLKKHRELQTFFDRNPRAHDQLQQDPSSFTRRDNRFETNATPKQRADRDEFLSKHKDIAGDLNANPGLVNDNDYLRRHKDLQAFLDKDPGMRDDFRNRTDNDRNRSEIAENARGNPNPDLTRQQLATMDQFLDGHEDIERQLRANPSLLDDPAYLRANPQLQTFLAQHPELRAEIRENPNYFVRRETQYDAREAAAARSPNPDLTRRELATMDQFLDGHEDIERQLRANPSLINDPTYLRANPQLQTFLGQHPILLNEFREDPNYFMRRENRFDARETVRDQARDRDQDANLTARQRKDRDDFFAKHRDIDRDLQANPALVNDNDYLRRHSDLRAFLDKDPEVREQFRSRSQEAENRQPGTPNFRPDQDLTPKQRADRDDFLAKHKDIDRDLHANPALVNDNDYLNKHRDLRAFLDKDPDVRERVRTNPSSIVPANTGTTPTRTEPVPARSANPKGTSSDLKNDKADVKSDKADIKSDRADIKSDRAKGDKADVKSDKADIKSDKADVKSDKANVKSDKAAAKDKAQKPQKPVDKPTPIEQREETQPPVH
jgi:hypothetical protein